MSVCYWRSIRLADTDAWPLSWYTGFVECCFAVSSEWLTKALGARAICNLHYGSKGTTQPKLMTPILLMAPATASSMLIDIAHAYILISRFSFYLLGIPWDTCLSSHLMSKFNTCNGIYDEVPTSGPQRDTYIHVHDLVPTSGPQRDTYTDVYDLVSTSGLQRYTYTDVYAWCLQAAYSAARTLTITTWYLQTAYSSTSWLASTIWPD